MHFGRAPQDQFHTITVASLALQSAHARKKNWKKMSVIRGGLLL
jgi:hypothetical protein